MPVIGEQEAVEGAEGAPRKIKKWMCAGARLQTPLCDYQADEKWLGPCPGCGGYRDIVRSVHGDPRGGEKMVVKEDAAPPKRISTGLRDVDRVMGGGIVQGQVVLLAGEPGGGKSTLAMQMCDHVARGKRRAMFVSAEQTTSDIMFTAQRIGISNDRIALRGNKAEIFSVIDDAKEVEPFVLVVDSINEVYLEDVEADIGTARQLAAVGQWLAGFAKTENVTVIIICQVTKDLELSGPKTLEHKVDTVLYLLGSSEHPLDPDLLDDEEQFSDKLSREDWERVRLLRVGKNRFGPPSQRAVMELSDEGIRSHPKRRGKLTVVE